MTRIHNAFNTHVPFVLLFTLALGLTGPAHAQTPAPPTPAPAAESPAPLPPVHGTVLFERHADVPAPTEAPLQSALPAATEQDKLNGSALSDDERAAPTITAYALDARITPDSSQLEMRARLTLRNDGTAPLTRIALQISSTLSWQSATLLGPENGPDRRTQLIVVQHLLETDTDHTGKSSEVVLALPTPLAPGASLRLDTLYGGTIPAAGERLERIGATREQALASDWDSISSASTALRGYGNVLWYPVASPQFFLGDGNKLFQAIGRSRLREEAATVQLHLALGYTGDAPRAVYFCGRRAQLKAVSDDSEFPVTPGAGIAIADLPVEPLGFRPISLFVVDLPEQLLAPLSSNANAPEDLLAVSTTDEAALPRLADSAESLAPLLQQWFGPHPLSALTLLDRKAETVRSSSSGRTVSVETVQPFEDGPLLLASAATLGGSSAAPALAHSLTHAFVQTGQPWMDEGLAQFIALLYTEQQQGREAATVALKELLRSVTLAEPAPETLTADDSGEPLIAAYDELYYRRKAAAVWWALRSIVGDESLQIALTTWREQPPSQGSARSQAIAFQHLLETVSRQQNQNVDLSWFFNDWVLRDRGLPDLTLVEVTPRPLPAGKGHDSGWLVAVTVRNDGAATAQVPLLLRAGNQSITKQMRIPGLSSATERVVLQSAPTQVQVNDGSIPELRDWRHTVNVTVQNQP